MDIIKTKCISFNRFDLFLLVLLLLINNIALCQVEEKQPNTLDDKNTPGAFFNSINLKNAEADINIKNAVKFDLSQLMRCNMTAFYERKIFKTLTIDAGIGYSFEMDIIQQLTVGIENEFSDFFNDNYYTGNLSLSSIITASYFYSGLPMFSIGIRKYFKNYYNTNTEYLEAQYCNNGFNTSIEDKINSIDYKGDNIICVKNDEVHCLYGLQYTTRGKMKLVHNIYFGFGIKWAHFDEVKLIKEYPDPTNLNDYIQYYTKTTNRLTYIAPMLIAGYALGLGF